MLVRYVLKVGQSCKIKDEKMYFVLPKTNSIQQGKCYIYGKALGWVVQKRCDYNTCSLALCPFLFHLSIALI